LNASLDRSCEDSPICCANWVPDLRDAGAWRQAAAEGRAKPLPIGSDVRAHKCELRRLIRHDGDQSGRADDMQRRVDRRAVHGRGRRASIEQDDVDAVRVGPDTSGGPLPCNPQVTNTADGPSFCTAIGRLRKAPSFAERAAWQIPTAGFASITVVMVARACAALVQSDGRKSFR